MADAPAEKPQKEWSFWDSWSSLPLLIAAIVLLRFWIVEPFKIPSGSMEPTLVGHEDYGDRIATNKLAYVNTSQVVLVTLGIVAILVIGFVASKGWKRTKTIVLTALVAILSLGGLGFAWTRGALAGDPQRFDVVVFQYDTNWAGDPKSQKINYIKRLIGLPGEEIKISGGDLYHRKNDEYDFEIIRKWQVKPEFQDSAWYPVALAWVKHNHKDISAEDARNLAFPWKGADAGTPGVKLEDHQLIIDGSAPVDLQFKYQATNTHIKQGRWMFEHKGCPEANKPGRQTPMGTFADPSQKSPFVRCYVENSWQGVQCPNCKQVVFPLNRLYSPGGGTTLVPRQPELSESAPSLVEKTSAPSEAPIKGGDNETADPQALPEVTRFFYGGQELTGDLKLELDLEVETPGKIELLVGSRLSDSSAGASQWNIGGQMTPSADTATDSLKVSKQISLTAGKHRVSLAYVDATLIATLDGETVDIIEQPSKPRGRTPPGYQTVARVRFEGFKGSVTRLDLFRDLYYLSRMPLSHSDPLKRQGNLRGFDADGNYFARIPAGFYLMLGDNAPSSSDGRIWGFVPRENLVGRASVIWWPPSRWRIIR
jgi:signal peptidase I